MTMPDRDDQPGYDEEPQTWEESCRIARQTRLDDAGHALGCEAYDGDFVPCSCGRAAEIRAMVEAGEVP